MPAKAILLVEDSSADAYLIQRAAEECGRNIELWTMADGPEALMFLRKEHLLTHVPTPALIIVDLRLPKMSSTQILTEIRQLPELITRPRLSSSVGRTKRKKKRPASNWGPPRLSKNHRTFTSSLTQSRRSLDAGSGQKVIGIRMKSLEIEG